MNIKILHLRVVVAWHGNPLYFHYDARDYQVGVSRWLP